MINVHVVEHFGPIVCVNIPSNEQEQKHGQRHHAGSKSRKLRTKLLVESIRRVIVGKRVM